MLADLKRYLVESGWTIEEPVGKYEVLRARKQGYPRPLLVYNREERGCGFSIDERDMKIYKGWQKNRRKRGMDPYIPTDAETDAERKPMWRGEKPWTTG